ncbi:hypothetical protein [Halosegnis longus]|uniref:hypothetical protein n=1 Tax=Halosegnis longus TaxID=2216012 RepID=UPI00129E52AD|nr:hypothetical protein [Halosegnis longus]
MSDDESADDERAQDLQQLRTRDRGTDQSTTESTESSDDELEPVTQRNHSTFYLSDEILNALDGSRKELEYLASNEFPDLDLEKNRHLRPLVILLGIEQLEEMDIEDVIDRLESDDRLDPVQ